MNCKYCGKPVENNQGICDECIKKLYYNKSIQKNNVKSKSENIWLIIIRIITIVIVGIVVWPSIIGFYVVSCAIPFIVVIFCCYLLYGIFSKNKISALEFGKLIMNILFVISIIIATMIILFMVMFCTSEIGY